MASLYTHLYIQVHTFTYKPHTYTCMHIQTHEDWQTHGHTCMHAQAHRHVHTDRQMHIYVHAHTYTCTCTHVHMYTQTRSHAHVHAHTHTQTHTHTQYTHTLKWQLQNHPITNNSNTMIYITVYTFIIQPKQEIHICTHKNCKLN